MKQRGMILVSAIFILIVLALAAASGVAIVNNSSNAAAFSILESKVYYAARAGLEFMAAYVKQNNTCPSATYDYQYLGSYLNGGSVLYTNGNLKETDASVTCTVTSNSSEGGQTLRVINLTSVGRILGSGGALNAQRTLSMTMTISCIAC